MNPPPNQALESELAALAAAAALARFVEPDGALLVVGAEGEWLLWASPGAGRLREVLSLSTATDRGAMEDSAQFYSDHDTLFLTCAVMGRRSDGPFSSEPVTFILTRSTLVTVRTNNPRDERHAATRR